MCDKTFSSCLIRGEFYLLPGWLINTNLALSSSLVAYHLANILPGSKRKKEEKPQPAVDRKLALLKLRDVACSGLREALWQDAEALSR